MTVLGANQPDSHDLQLGILDVPLAVPHVRGEGCKGEPHTRLGFIRSVHHIYHAFAVNTFIDEIAHSKGQDPLEGMLEVYGPARVLSLRELGIPAFGMTGSPYWKFPSDAGRLRAVLERAAELAQWTDRASQPDRGYGLAAHRCASSYVGVVAAVRRGGDQGIVIDEIWLAADAGLLVNPDRVRAQMEGSVINSLSHFLYGGVTHKNGAVEQDNFDGVKLVRMNTAPRRITVELLRTDHPPGGVGEPGVPPVAPAVANAIFALTGRRIREFGLARLA
jgi:isoquinoline 1-oxidoreductase beta subunit